MKNKAFAKFIGVILNVVLVAGITHTELEAMNVSCSTQGLCNGNDEKSFENCFCDRICAEFGDCCPDATNFNLEKQTLSEGYKCVTLGDNGVYMKGRCMTGWEGPEMARLCEAASPGDISRSREPVTHLPVTSNTTFRTYSNYYCAICNNDSSSLAFWETRVEFDQFHNLVTEEYVASNLVFKNDTWGIFAPSDEKIFYSCTIILSIHKTARKCYSYPVTKSCNDSWTDASVEDLCHSYTAVRYSKGSAYKNPHCAMCNFVHREDFHCYEYFEDSDIVLGFGFADFIPISFNVLVDFFDCSGNSDVGAKSVCQSMEKDPQFCSCTSVSDSNAKILRPEKEEKFTQAIAWVSQVGLGLSCFCLLLHLVTFLLVAHMKNLPGISNASLSLSLLTAYIIFIVSAFIRPNTIECYILGAAMYYSFLASFCWMNVMAFDVWHTSRQASKELRVSRGRQGIKLVAYLMYGWLLPALAVVVMVTIDRVAPVSLPSEFLPSLGQRWCWFGKRKALMVFFGTPLIVVMVLNVIFFLATAYIIAGSRGSGLRVSSCSRQKKRFFIYIRLAVLMGLSWISGIVAGYLQLEVVWYIFVVLNTLQGVFIFLAFTCRSKVWQALREFGHKRLQVAVCGMPGSDPSVTWTSSLQETATISSSQLSVHTESTHL